MIYYTKPSMAPCVKVLCLGVLQGGLYLYWDRAIASEMGMNTNTVMNLYLIIYPSNIINLVIITRRAIKMLPTLKNLNLIPNSDV